MMFRLDHACKNRENAKFSSKTRNDMIILPISVFFFFENYRVYSRSQLTSVIGSIIISLRVFEENFAFSLFLHA